MNIEHELNLIYCTPHVLQIMQAYKTYINNPSHLHWEALAASVSDNRNKIEAILGRPLFVSDLGKAGELFNLCIETLK